MKSVNEDTFLGGELGLGHALVTHMVEEFRKDEGVDINQGCYGTQTVHESAERPN